MGALAALRLIAIALPLAAGPMGVRLPALASLERAERRGDSVEVERLARRLGVARLLRAAEDATLDGARRGAALDALPLVDDAWAALAPLLALADDPAVGAKALAAARRTAEALTPERAMQTEMPPDVPARAASTLARLVEDRAADPARRVEAARALAALAPLLRPSPPSPWLELLRDPSPSVRRAALEALDVSDDPPEQRGELVRRLEFLLGDDDRAVAALAGARLCHLTTAAGWEEALPEPVRDRVRAIAADATLDAGARRPLAACLHAFATPPDQKLARELERAPRRRR